MAQPYVIIEPGHGGQDPGASMGTFLEKYWNLKISLYQYQRFQELGIPVAMTRTDDVFISPQDRAAMVRNSGARYCIANHNNAGGGSGSETIHSIFTDAKLATAILDALTREGLQRRRVFTRTLKDQQQDWDFIIRWTRPVETVIVEYTFIDNANDREKLQRYWQVYAEAVVKAFCSHVGKPYNAPGAPPEDANAIWVVQAGAFRSKPNADALAEKLKAAGFSAYIHKA